MVPAEIDAPESLGRFREVVLHAVHRCGGATSDAVFLPEALRREFERVGFPRRLRGPANRVASGIVRRRMTLDHLIGLFSNVPLRKMAPLLLDVLRLAVYEIVFVERIPARASVDEAVNLTRKFVREEFSGFTNAVLRELVRTIDKTGAAAPTSRGLAPQPPPHPDPLPPQGGEGKRSGLSPRELPVAPGRVVRFKRDVFPDPATDPAGWLSVAGGMPLWLVERWRRNFGAGGVFQVVEASNAHPPVSIRVNTLKTTDGELAARLERAGVEAAPGGVEHGLCLESAVELTALDAFREGEFYIQDISAMRAPRLLDPKDGEKVLDLCAAPGGKTMHLAELAGDRAEIFALDLSPERLALVEQNAQRLGITGIRTCTGDARRIPEEMKGAFDAVLADVPCSNTGVLRRRVEARHRLRPETIDRLAGVQAGILQTALAAARAGGRVVYCTCSIEPEENGELVRRALERAPDWTLDAEEALLPEPDGPDGGYVARLICR